MEVWVPVVFIACVAGSFLHRKYTVNKVMSQLSVALLDDGGSGGYMDILDSLTVKFYFSDFSKAFLRINYYILHDNAPRVKEQCKAIKGLRMVRHRDKIALYRQLLSYFGQRGDAAGAADAYDNLEACLTATQNPQDRMLLYEADSIMDVYIRKDPAKIPQLERLLEGTSDPETRAVYLFRLAKLHYYGSDKEQSARLLILAKENTKSRANIAAINEILEGHWGKL